MTDIETEKFRQIGIDLINEYRKQRGLRPIDWLAIDTPEVSAFIRSIQLHEKTKKELADCKQELADYKQKVSDALQSWVDGGIDRPAYLWFRKKLEQFIIAKPDPLVEVLDKMLRRRFLDPLPDVLADEAHWLRAALDALGFEIREKNDGQPNSN